MITKMDEKGFLKEFANRSKVLLDNYQGDYDATMLVISLLGLIVIPRERFCGNLPDDAISNTTLLALQKSVTVNEKNGIPYNDTSLDYICRNIRHALCHGHIMFYGEQPVYNDKPFVVDNVEFTNNYNGTKFVIRLQINDIRDLVN